MKKSRIAATGYTILFTGKDGKTIYKRRWSMYSGSDELIIEADVSFTEK